MNVRSWYETIDNKLTNCFRYSANKISEYKTIGLGLVTTLLLGTTLLSACSSPSEAAPTQSIPTEAVITETVTSLESTVETSVITPTMNVPSPTIAPTYPPTDTPAPNATAAPPTATMEQTEIPIAELIVRLGHDANLSGFIDNAQFYCPGPDEFPPGLAEYQYVDAISRVFPGAVGCTPGMLQVEPEPGLPGFTISTEVNGQIISATTDANGFASLQIPGGEAGQEYKLEIIDPHAGNPELAMTDYVKFSRFVTVPETTLTGSKGGQVTFPEQTLNSTLLTSLPVPNLYVTIGETNEIPLSQGWQTAQHGHLSNYFTPDHYGLDWGNDPGTFVIAMAPAVIADNTISDQYGVYGVQMHVPTERVEYEGNTCDVFLTSGHMRDHYLPLHTRVERGQIISVHSDTGQTWVHDHTNLRYQCPETYEINPFEVGSLSVRGLPVLPFLVDWQPTLDASRIIDNDILK